MFSAQTSCCSFNTFIHLVFFLPSPSITSNMLASKLIPNTTEVFSTWWRFLFCCATGCINLADCGSETFFLKPLTCCFEGGELLQVVCWGFTAKAFLLPLLLCPPPPWRQQPWKHMYELWILSLFLFYFAILLFPNVIVCRNKPLFHFSFKLICTVCVCVSVWEWLKRNESWNNHLCRLVSFLGWLYSSFWTRQSLFLQF